MKPSSLLPLLTLSACLVGCNDQTEKPSEGHAQAHEEHGITYKANQGLSVPEEIARHIGLKLDDVTERKVNGQLVFTAQVYGEVGPRARRVTLASAWVASTLAKSIPSGTDIIATTADTNSLTGTVTRVVPAASTNSSAEILVEFRAEQVEPRLGDFLRITVSTPGKEEVAVIPHAALLRTAEGTFAYVVNGSRLTRTAIKVGGEQDGIIEVKDGLLAGDKIAVSGVPLLWLAELQGIRGGKACADGH